jgi:hypothetical protein
MTFMKLQQWLQSLLRLTVQLSPPLLGFFILPSQSLAQLSPMTISLKFPQPVDRGAPERTVGGGARFTPGKPPEQISPEPESAPDTLLRPPSPINRTGVSSCSNVEPGKLPLTALMPTRENVGKTVAESPTLYWYVPPTKAESGELVVMDEAENIIYKRNFPLPKSGGIIKLTIPANAGMKLGQSYRWYFNVVCNSEDRGEDEYTAGLIEFTHLGNVLENQLEQASLIKRAEIYAKNYIWYDALDSIARIRGEKAQEWEELLTSVGLGAIAKEPILDPLAPQR